MPSLTPFAKFTKAISLFVSCGDPTEVDFFWDRLRAGGGSASQCGWLKDRFNLIEIVALQKGSRRRL